MYTINIALESLVKFRSLMGMPISKDNVKYIWGKKYLKSIDKDRLKLFVDKDNIFVSEKVEICKRDISKLKVFNWVKFIGISGSVAAGFAKEEDDIDIFVVVKNDTAWIYRAILAFNNIFSRKIRTKWDGDSVKDKFCLNLICEERDVVFDNDMFNFHELMYLVPVYNEKYLNYIYSQNIWLRTEYGVKNELMVSRVMVNSRDNVFLKIINSIAFFFQLIFMIITKHSPEVSRLKENFNRGRIEFFPSDYKRNIIEGYLR